MGVANGPQPSVCKIFLLHEKETSCSLAIISHHSLPPAPGNHSSTSCLYLPTQDISHPWSHSMCIICIWQLSSIIRVTIKYENVSLWLWCSYSAFCFYTQHRLPVMSNTIVNIWVEREELEGKGQAPASKLQCSFTHPCLIQQMTSSQHSHMRDKTDSLNMNSLGSSQLIRKKNI